MKRNYPEKPFFSWMAWGMLRACPQRWFLYNFGRDLPGEIGRSMLAERRLSFWQAFGGQLADDGVTETIRHFKRNRVWRQDMDEWLHERAFEYIRESREYTRAAKTGEPLPYVKHQVLDRYYYDSIPTKEEHKTVLEGAREAVRLFYQSEIPAMIEAAPSEALMADHKDGEFPWAEHNGVPVYAVYDFAIKLPHRLTIFDWKTGKVTPEKEEAALEQLHWYALYAMVAWQVEPENIRLAPVFLSPNYTYYEVEPNPALLRSIQTQWKSVHDEIKGKMARSQSVQELQTEFEMTEKLRECIGCVFRSCPGYARTKQERGQNPVKFAILGEND